MQLNPIQHQAMVCVTGPLLIIAGAGSGKTATLTQRIAYMISECGIRPSSILALTFTNKAAGEMKERTGKTIGAEYHPYMLKNRHLPYIGTFHSFGIYVLKEILSHNFTHYQQVSESIGLKENFIIYDESDKISVMKDIIKNEMGLIEKEYPARQIAHYISDAKNKSLDSRGYKNQADGMLAEVVGSVFERYEKRLQANNAMDFDDILSKLLQAFHLKIVLDIFHERYEYIMVDEYQDTNLIQYEIVALLALKHKNLAVVGDDWQSIYSWRGADMRNIIHFNKDYPSATVVKLEQNYRSTKNIINAANVVIKNNKEALDKELWTENNEGTKIQYLEAYDDKGEANWIATNIKDYNDEDIENKLSDNLILYRTNAQSRGIEEGLLKKNIPYIVVGGLKFYERKEIKDILSYLRIIHNPNEPVAFGRIVNTPTRGVGAKSAEIVHNYRNDYSISYLQVLENIEEIDELRPAAKSSLSEFYSVLQSLISQSNTLKLSTLVGEVIERIRYKDYLKTQFSGDELDSKLENLTELQNVASEYDGLDPRESLSMFLEEVALISDLDKTTEPEDRVTLMTIHSSKGLEQKRVFVTGLEDGIFPHSRTHSNMRELEEERRLMYVAMTRAKQELFLTRAKERLYFGDYVRNPESRFILEIPAENIESIELGGGFSFDTSNSFSGADYESTMRVAKKVVKQNNVSDFKAGQRVYHHKFGEGRIESLVGELAELRFSSGIKKMNIRIAPVKLIADE
ncbi:UvrD-helicase domain-containing protein [Candidatus Gracilibacteria bacterium]|nr:UvrD-helicase domain-containing protein [Candidatus Gracilibacteria bacterium]